MSLDSKHFLGLLGSFGLGVVATLATLHPPGRDDAASAAYERHHGALAEGSLENAIAVSAGLLHLQPAAAAAPTAMMPGDIGALLAQAEQHRHKREFARACEAYAILVERDAMTADTWADYADAQAALTGKLSGEPARAIDAALALDARHAKALWLKASLAHEERRYDEALATWQRLLAVVPAGSSDARIVEANIAEAARLARG